MCDSFDEIGTETDFTTYHSRAWIARPQSWLGTVTPQIVGMLYNRLLEDYTLLVAGLELENGSILIIFHQFDARSLPLLERIKKEFPQYVFFECQ